MSSQRAEKAAIHGSPAVLSTHFYLLSCICQRPMIEHDFPSKHETTQTYSFSIKTHNPSKPQRFPRSSHRAYNPHDPDLWGPNKVMNLVKVSVTSNRMEGGKCHVDFFLIIENSQEWAFENQAPSLHLRRETSGERPCSLNVPNTGPAFTKFRQCVWRVNRKWGLFFLYSLLWW